MSTCGLADALEMRPAAPSDVRAIVRLLTAPRAALFFREPMRGGRVVRWLSDKDVWTFWRGDRLAVVGVAEPEDEHGSVMIHGVAGDMGLGGPRLTYRALLDGVDHYFDRGVRRLVAAPLEGNVAASRLLAMAGFQHEGTMRKAVKVGSAYRDILLYARLRED